MSEAERVRKRLLGIRCVTPICRRKSTVVACVKVANVSVKRDGVYERLRSLWSSY